MAPKPRNNPEPTKTEPDEPQVNALAEQLDRLAEDAETINPFAGIDPDAIGNAQLDDAVMASEEADINRSTKRIIREERRAQVLAMRRNSVPFRVIAEQLGVSVSTAHDLWREALASLCPTEDLENARTAELDRLDRLRMAYAERAFSGDEAAARVWMAAHDRYVKITGMDQFEQRLFLDASGVSSVQVADQLITEIAEKYRRRPAPLPSMN